MNALGWLSGGYVVNDLTSWWSPKEDDEPEVILNKEKQKGIVRVVMWIVFIAAVVVLVIMKMKQNKGGRNVRI
jgi:hypothetical protein